MIEIIGDIKSNATRLWWHYGGHVTIWQRSFHDHGIRGREDFEATVAYIFENPIKAGLVEAWEDYPHIGGALVESL